MSVSVHALIISSKKKVRDMQHQLFIFKFTDMKTTNLPSASL